MGLGNSLGSIIHPHLHEELGMFFPSTIEVQSAVQTISADGEPHLEWTTFLETIPANLAPRYSTEVRGDRMTRVTRGWALNLAGYYPQITELHRVIVGSTAYNIVGVASDSLSQSTRLDLEIGRF